VCGSLAILSFTVAGSTNDSLEAWKWQTPHVVLALPLEGGD
jgi:hypothetical protein